MTARATASGFRDALRRRPSAPSFGRQQPPHRRSSGAAAGACVRPGALRACASPLSASPVPPAS
eukprot:4417863-Prymnesium_polylepis.1